MPVQTGARPSWQKPVLIVFNLAGVGAAVWLNQFPSQVALYACLAAPVVIIVLAAVGRFALLWDDADERLKLTWGFLPPFLAVGAFSLFDPTLLDKGRAVIPAVVAAAVVMAIVFAIDRRFKLWMTLAAVVIAFTGCWGGVMVANYKLDRSAGTVYRADIVHKFKVRARRGNINYTIQTTPWGPADTPNAIDVNPDAYDRFAEGQTLCFTLHPGAFGYRWYEFDSCR